MTVRLYVVSDAKTAVDYLVCAKTSSGAMNYIAKNVLMGLSAKSASAMGVLLCSKNGHEVLGEKDDLAAIGFGNASENEN